MNAAAAAGQETKNNKKREKKLNKLTIQVQRDFTADGRRYVIVGCLTRVLGVQMMAFQFLQMQHVFHFFLAHRNVRVVEQCIFSPPRQSWLWTTYIHI